jgi:hypothetical protein
MSGIEVSVVDLTIDVDVVGQPGISGGRLMQVVDFPVPQSVWVVDVGQSTDVVVINSAGEVVWPGKVTYGPGTQVTMHFSAPFSGRAQCYF